MSYKQSSYLNVLTITSTGLCFWQSSFIKPFCFSSIFSNNWQCPSILFPWVLNDRVILKAIIIYRLLKNPTVASLYNAFFILAHFDGQCCFITHVYREVSNKGQAPLSFETLYMIVTLCLRELVVKLFFMFFLFFFKILIYSSAHMGTDWHSYHIA